MAGAALIAPAQPITPQTSAIRDRPLAALSADTSSTFALGPERGLAMH